jgi:hypothetical protein
MKIGFSTRMKLITVIAVLCTFLVGPIAVSHGQNERRGEFVQGLLKTFLESQLEKNDHQRDNHPRHPKPPANADLVKFRSSSKELRDNTGRLFNALQQEAPNTPALRHHMHSMMDVHAAADVLYRQGAQANQASQLQKDLATFDKKWRVLSYRLQEESRIPPGLQQLVGAIDGQCASLCKMVGIQPQINRAELARAADTLSTELRHLVETIDLELGRTQQCRDLTIQGQRNVQLARLLSIAINTRPDNESIVRSFQQWHSDWLRFAAALYTLSNRHLERDLQHVDEEVRELHALLWLPLPVDYRQLSHLNGLMKDIDQLFDSVSLNTLLSLRTSQNVLTTSSEFYGLCEHFTLVIEDEEPIDHMVRDFRDLERSWPQLSGCFKTSRDPLIVGAIRSIDQTFVSLRDALRIRPDNNADLALQVTASLDVLGEQLNQELNRRIFRSSRYPEEFVRGINSGLATFKAQMEGIEHALAQNATLPSLRNACRDSLRTWTKINTDYVARLPQQHRAMVVPYTSEITNQLVQLETLVAE